MPHAPAFPMGEALLKGVEHAFRGSEEVRGGRNASSRLRFPETPALLLRPLSFRPMIRGSERLWRSGPPGSEMRAAMPPRAAEVPRSPSRESRFPRSLQPDRRRARRVAVIVAATVTLLLLTGPLAQAGTFPVLQEQVLTGTSTGIVGAQAADGLRETLTEADAPVALTTAPSAQNVTVGSQVAGAFPSDVATLDGAYVRYREATPGAVTVMSNPATTGSGCTWTSCDNGRLSDNTSASSSTGGDVANYSSFLLSLPASSVILSVELGYEAFNPGGNDRLSMTVSWDGGTTWCPAFTATGLPTADPNAYAFVNLTACGGHPWIAADFGANLTARFTHVVLGGADTIDLDANLVRVTYQPLAYQLGVRYDWEGVLSGAAYVLALTGHVSNDSVSVEVLTPPSSWTACLTLGDPTDQNLSCSLAPSEVASGNVAIRVVDAQGSSPTPSDLWLDFVAVVTTQHAYHLDVVQNVTGVTGPDPTLVVEGNVSAGGENFDVFVWDSSTSTWTAALSAPFTAANAVHSVSLTADEISNGAVRISFRDKEPASAAAATLTLDFVGVQTTDAAATFPWPLVLGGVAAAIILLAVFVFMFLLPRRRRSAPRDSGEGSVEPAESAGVAEIVEALPAPAAEEDVSGVPTVDPEALEPGHAYLVVGDGAEAAPQALETLTRLGRSGLVITGRSASELERLIRPRHTTVMVLGGEAGAVAAPVTDGNRDMVLSAIEAFLRTNPVGVILFDRIEGLAGPGGMSALLDVVQRTAERASQGQQMLLASASTGSLHEAHGQRLRRLLTSVSLSAPSSSRADLG